MSCLGFPPRPYLASASCSDRPCLSCCRAARRTSRAAFSCSRNSFSLDTVASACPWREDSWRSCSDRCELTLAGGKRESRTKDRVLSLEFCAEPASATSASAGGERAPVLRAGSLRASAPYHANTLGCRKALGLLTWKWWVRPRWAAWDHTAPSQQT